MELSILDRALSECVYLCVNADTTLMTTNCNKHGAPPVTAPPELIKKTFESIMLCWPRGETRRALSGLPVPGTKKIVITPAEERAAQHQLGRRISLKLSLRKQRRMMNDISGRTAHDVAAAEVCVKDDVREGIQRW